MSEEILIVRHYKNSPSIEMMDESKFSELQKENGFPTTVNRIENNQELGIILRQIYRPRNKDGKVYDPVTRAVLAIDELPDYFSRPTER